MSGAGSSSLLPLESLLLPKTSPCKRFMAIAPGQTSKSGCQKCFVNSISMSHYAVTKSKSQAKNTYSMKSLKSPCSSQNPMGRWPSMTMLKVWHWRSNMSPDSRGLFHTKIDCARQGPRWTLFQTQHGSLTYIGAPFGAAHGLPPGLHILHTDMATDKQGNDWYKLCCKK